MAPRTPPTPTGILERRLKSRPIGEPVGRAMMNVQVANAHFEEDFYDIVTSKADLSVTAFNVLRILRGEPDGHPRGEIAQRLISRRTDVTRVIDGLVRRGLAERTRSRTDRRLSLTRITPKGLKVVARLDALVADLVARYRDALTGREWDALSHLLERFYAHHVE